jgi:hypothetical protein
MESEVLVFAAQGAQGRKKWVVLLLVVVVGHTSQ